MAQTEANRTTTSIGIGFGTGYTVSGFATLTGTETGRNAAENARCQEGIGIGGGSQTLFSTNVLGSTPSDAELKRVAAFAGIAGGSQSRYSA